MLTDKELMTVIDVEIDFHEECLAKIKEKKENIVDYYRHERVLSAMKQIKSKLLSTPIEDDIVDTFDNIQDVSIREKVFEYLKTTDIFNGIDPFDDNISDISRMNGFIVYIMSDGKQRNLPNIMKELNEIYPDNKFTEHNIYRRIYALHSKGILVKQQMKGYYRLK